MPDLDLMMTVDVTNDVAYIRVCRGEVARTVEVTEAVSVDMDRFNMVLGIEVLELAADMPFSQLVSEFHVPEQAISALRAIRPSVSGFLRLSFGGDGSLSGVGQPVSV